MLSRRHFIQQSSLATMAFGVPGFFSFLFKDDKNFCYESAYLKLKLFRSKPELSFFSTDSLGTNHFLLSPLMASEERSNNLYKSHISSEGIAYFLNEGKQGAPLWDFNAKSKILTIRTQWKGNNVQDPFAITFSQKANHCTVLGTMIEENKMKFPCLLHFPGMGSFRLYCDDPTISLYYAAELTDKPYIKISFPAADKEHQDITYKLESVAIYPEIDKVKSDERYDGFKRNYINIFQFSPGFRLLANNSTSDACAFTVFLYAEMARATPLLVEGLTAMDLIRNTVDEYLNGKIGYGMVGKVNWDSEYNSSDSFPSLVLASCYYILDTKDLDWARQHYEGIHQWAGKIMATDTNNDGIIEYGYSGNAGSWKGKKFKRPANWWDTIGFGHDDAYSNAIAYRALVELAQVAKLLKKEKDYLQFNAFTKKLKSNYYARFYNPKSGLLGGWRSADGELHDYYFTFVNSIAICYGLVEKDQAIGMMKALLQKMKEVGYTNFRLGLPGNLIPIADEDYVALDPRWGYQQFQVYENGGATGCYAYYTIKALFDLGMRDEALKILMPMLESYKEGGFEGYCSDNNLTKDWKTWDGKCWGYEGFLVDNYLALLAVLDV